MKKNEILVFESNLAGQHTSIAAARAQRYYGAIPGQANGLQGRCYALPTYDREGRPLKFHYLEDFFYEFYLCAQENAQLLFHFEAFDYRSLQINLQQVKKLFSAVPDNVRLPPEILQALK